MNQPSTTQTRVAHLQAIGNRPATLRHIQGLKVKGGDIAVSALHSAAGEFVEALILAIRIREDGNPSSSPRAITPADLARIDSEIVRLAFDSEVIFRERAAPAYQLLPRADNDAATVKAAGGTLTEQFIDPVIIHTCSPDE